MRYQITKGTHQHIRLFGATKDKFEVFNLGVVMSIWHVRHRHIMLARVENELGRKPGVESKKGSKGKNVL